jgi:hypothetical protein
MELGIGYIKGFCIGITCDEIEDVENFTSIRIYLGVLFIEILLL